MAKQISSPLKWAGGKSWAVDVVKEIYSPFLSRRFVDITFGAGSLPLNLAANEVLAVDINPHLINFWKWLQSDGEMTVFCENDRDAYLALRKDFNRYRNDPSMKEWCGQAFWWLNRLCFNAVWRVNSKGGFNVPFGKHSSVRQVDFAAYRELIHGWEFVCSDFGDIVIQANDFVLADPPYHKTFTGYSKENFEWEDQVRLCTFLASLPSGVPVVAFNSDCDEIKGLYLSNGFSIALVKGRTDALAAKTTSRKQKYELILTRNI